MNPSEVRETLTVLYQKKMSLSKGKVAKRHSFKNKLFFTEKMSLSKGKVVKRHSFKNNLIALYLSEKNVLADGV